MTVRALLLLALFVATTTPVSAHPHVWIDMRSAIDFNAQGRVDAIGVSWTFDEFYSQSMLDGTDRNNNHNYDANELQDLANAMAKNLKGFRYFMFIQVGNKLADTGTPTDAKATYEKGQLTLNFRLPLQQPVDPATTSVSYSSFDPTYYVDISPAQSNGVVFTGPAPKTCTYALRKVDSTRAGALNLSQSVQMTRPTTDVLNSTSAAVVSVTCSPAKKQ
jgi:ABC-type uncharacterized transport system substrate-binding protein